MISDKRVSNILENLYESARTGSAESWLGVYRQIAELMSSGLGGLTLLCSRSGKLEVVATDFDDETLKIYDEYYQYIDPIRAYVRSLRPGESLSRILVYPDKQFLHSEIYQDYFQKLDIYEIEYHALGPTSEISGGLTLTRPRSNPKFTQAERKALDFLVPHLQRGFHLYMLLAGAKRENLQMTETLSKIPQSIIVLDRNSTVIFRNSSAETVISEKDGLNVVRGKLEARSLQDTQKLRKALASVFALQNNDLQDPVKIVEISRPSGRRPLQVLVAPFCQDVPSLRGETLALVFVFDPEVRPITVDSILMRVYGLTPAEARITSLLAQGLSTKDAGEALNISENTVRTHLKRIFSKTQTSRQSDLINLVLSGPANLNNHSL